jgi:hypothetical protein
VETNIFQDKKMNEAISALAASNTTETLAPVDIFSAVVQEADKVEDAIENVVVTEVVHTKSEVAKLEAEAEMAIAAAEAEGLKIEEAALRVEGDIRNKARNVFQETEAFVEKEAKKVWHIAHGGGSVLKNPA